MVPLAYVISETENAGEAASSAWNLTLKFNPNRKKTRKRKRKKKNLKASTVKVNAVATTKIWIAGRGAINAWMSTLEVKPK